MMGPSVSRFWAKGWWTVLHWLSAAVSLGLLTALFAALAGASEVVVADPSPFRRACAEALGLTAMEEGQAVDYAKARWRHGGNDRGSDIVFHR